MTRMSDWRPGIGFFELCTVEIGDSSIWVRCATTLEHGADCGGYAFLASTNYYCRIRSTALVLGQPGRFGGAGGGSAAAYLRFRTRTYLV